MLDINININVGEEPEVSINKDKIKRRVRKLPTGKETILELPNTTETMGNRNSNILDLMGMGTD